MSAAKKDIFQRYGPAALLIIIGALLFARAGILGLVAGAAVVLIFSFVVALFVTLFGAKRSSPDEPLLPLHRRFVRNFWEGIKEFPFYLNP